MRCWREASALLIADSLVKQPAHSRPKDGVASLAYARKILKQQTDVIHRPHYLVGVGSAVISLPSPREGAERRNGAGNIGHPLEVPRAV